MAASVSDAVTWKEIELAESYLICGMFEDATALASSILMRIRENEHIITGDDLLLNDMLESVGMVLVQSLRESGRTAELLGELETYFGSPTAIPAQIVLTGACIQVSSGCPSEARTFLEEFLQKRQLVDGKYHVATGSDVPVTRMQKYEAQTVLEVDKYLEIAEFYSTTLLGNVLKDLDHAILWVEKAQLPEEARQDLLRRLHSMYSLKTTRSTQESGSSTSADESERQSHSVKEIIQSDEPEISLNSESRVGVGNMRHSILKRPRLQSIIERFTNAIGIVTNGKILFGCSIFLVCYYIAKKQHAVKRDARRRWVSLRQALVDLWSLAFSYQVNPLAAVQPLPASGTGPR